jgi:hypothetical protein
MITAVPFSLAGGDVVLSGPVVRDGKSKQKSNPTTRIAFSGTGCEDQRYLTVGTSPCRWLK